MYFIVSWISYVFGCFLFYVFYCCLISAVWDLHLESISSWINDIQSKKRTKLLIYRPKWKIHFAICFVHKMKKISLFGLTFGRKGSCDSVLNGRSDFRKLGVKLSARLQRKKSWSGAAKSAAVLRVRQNLSRGGLLGPPSAVRVKGEASPSIHADWVNGRWF